MQTAADGSAFVVSRWLFLRLLGVVYLTAFGSMAWQIIGLNGLHGVLPTHQLLEIVRERLGGPGYWFYPTLSWFDSSDYALQLIAWAGTALSFLVIFGIATGPALLMLGILWLSLVTGGGEFTEFQSDGMLLEATWLSLFFVPWQWFEPPWPVPKNLVKQRPPPKASLWLLRFMVFRLMFASALVKIVSGDPTWRDLTALDYHFETQPIPTPLAWYAHWLPQWLHQGFVVGMYISEFVAPIMIFLGRKPRVAAAFLICSLHVMIALTGNYTFLNFLAMVLCLPLLDDGVVSKVVPASIVQSIREAQDQTAPNPIFRRIFNMAAAFLIFIAASVFASRTLGLALPEVVESMIGTIAPFHVADSYGLFAVMTTSRPEIVFEGSSDGKTWLPYEFKYKVGDDLHRAPPWVEPHMPRLDWRLWFAAMEPVDANPWVLGLVRALLDGSPDVNQFFVGNPFPGAPPRLIRAYVYDYHFTTPEERQHTGCWWRRDNKRIYLPDLALVNGRLTVVTDPNLTE